MTTMTGAVARARIAELEIEVEQLRAAINRYLDNDGSRGRFDALELHDARNALRVALDEDQR